MPAVKPVIVMVVAFISGEGVQMRQPDAPEYLYCNIYSDRLLCASHANIMESLVCSVLLKSVGAEGAETFVVAIVVEDAEPLALVAVNWNSYAFPAVKPVIVVVVAVVVGAGVHVVQLESVDFLY